jgi:hypothetical protein
MPDASLVLAALALIAITNVLGYEVKRLTS